MSPPRIARDQREQRHAEHSRHQRDPEDGLEAVAGRDQGKGDSWTDKRAKRVQRFVETERFAEVFLLDRAGEHGGSNRLPQPPAHPG
jgi:hypothetical protein